MPHPRWLAAALLLAAPAPAQFVNRAVWLGFDGEGVRRQFRQGTEYWLDRTSYVSLPPWWDADLDPWGDRVDYRFGSVSAREFTVDGTLDHHLPLADGFRFRYHLHQGEHRDARYLTNAVALEADLSARTALFAQGEILADKSAADLSVGAWFCRTERSALRLMVTAVDFADAKSLRAEHDVDPYAVQFAGVLGEREGDRVTWELAAQLPFRARDLQDQAAFGMERWLGRVQGRLRLDGDDWLVAAGEAEWTVKDLRPDQAGSPLREDFHRSFQQVRVEWWRQVRPLEWSVGLQATHQDEVGRRPFDPAADLGIRRQEWLLLARTRLPAGEHLSFEPQVFLGVVDLDELAGTGAPAHSRTSFEGKLAWNARWEFRPGTALALVVSLQLDEPAFGGGGAQFVARF